jgi:hypothetical protein
MSARKRETGCAMVKLCIEPRIHTMAGGTVRREATGNVVGSGS